MTLTVRTTKIDKINNRTIVYKEYRYAAFDSLVTADSFEEKFNKAMEVLHNEINEDRLNNDMLQFSPIKIADVFLS